MVGPVNVKKIYAKTIKKNTNSTQTKSQTHRAKQYEVTSLSTYCELSIETCFFGIFGFRGVNISKVKNPGKCHDLQIICKIKNKTCGWIREIVGGFRG